MAEQHMDSGKRKWGILKKIALGLLIVVFFVFGIVFAFLNLRKNQISEELLERVNLEFQGEFTVGSISVGNLFDYPNLEVKIRNLQFWESKAGSGERRNVIIDVPYARFKTDLKDVLKTNIHINRLELQEPRLFIERDSSGVQIISKAFKPLRKRSKKPDSTQLVLKIDLIRMNGARVTIVDRPTGVIIPIDVEELKGDFELKDDRIRGNIDLGVNGRTLMDTLKLKTRDFDISLKGPYDIDLKRRRLVVKSPLTEIAENDFDLDLNLDYRDKNVLNMDLNSAGEGLKLENLLYSDRDSLSDDQQLAFKGNVGFTSHLKWVPQSEISFLESVNLFFKIEGRDLRLKGADLDKFIDNFRRSQKFNLADVGAVMFAGPAGLAITKGGDYASLAFSSRGDSTQVGEFLAEWSLNKGILRTNDVALSTLRNRLSVDGKYNLVNDSLRFNFHVLDKKGCEMVGQRIYGNSEEIKMGRVNLIKTFLGPVKNFFRDLGMAKCDIVYQGKVQHPGSKKKKKGP